MPIAASGRPVVGGRLTKVSTAGLLALPCVDRGVAWMALYRFSCNLTPWTRSERT